MLRWRARAGYAPTAGKDAGASLMPALPSSPPSDNGNSKPGNWIVAIDDPSERKLADLSLYTNVSASVAEDGG